MIRSAFDYARCFTACLGDRQKRALLNAHSTRPDPAQGDRGTALRSALAWFAFAQDQGADAGIGSYHLVDGWSTSYPETTGYIIPTLLAAAEHLGSPEHAERAMRAAEWLLTIQREDGGWQGGRIGEDRLSIVFNTAQVIRGLVAAHAQAPRKDLLEAAIRAGEWLVSTQERTGHWRRHNFLGVARVYDTYVDVPLLRLHKVTGDERFKLAAERNLTWALSQRWANGWFSNCDNTIKHNERPITHTIAYTIDGFIDCGLSLGNERWINAGARAADVLLEIFLRDGWLHGRYNDHWIGSESLITTGCAQLAVAWARLHGHTGEGRYREGLERMVALLTAIQDKSNSGPRDAHGALSGSHPLWGRYEKFAFPNWSTKYFVDALLCAEGRLPIF